MEALALGCKKVEGSVCEGVIVPSDLPVESNPYLTRTITAKSMFDRLDILTKDADVIIALPGYLGTLNEVIMAVTLDYITDDNKRKRKPIFLSAHPWKAIWDSVAAELDVRYTGWEAEL